MTSYLLLGWKIDRDGRLHVFAEATTDAPHDNPKKLEGHIAYVRFDSYRGENPLYSDITALYRYTGSLNNIIETEAGRLVVPFSTFLGDNFVSGTIWSDDHGVSWKASNDVSVSSEETSAESGAVEPVVAKDYILLKGGMDKLLLKEGEFCIVFPEDAHLPGGFGRTTDKLKKAIVKIKLD